MTVDHIGIVVKDIEAAVPFYQKALGLEVSHREDVPAYKVKVAFLQAGETSIELLEPTGDGGIAEFLAKRGPGMHHVAFGVKNIGEHMKRLVQIGLPPIEKAPRDGSRGHKVCFLHPKFADGVLVELVEHA
jgi:methylmalonyl-CoA/ethylmalonyl-CoA epimerase